MYWLVLILPFLLPSRKYQHTEKSRLCFVKASMAVHVIKSGHFLQRQLIFAKFRMLQFSFIYGMWQNADSAVRTSIEMTSNTELTWFRFHLKLHCTYM